MSALDSAGDGLTRVRLTIDDVDASDIFFDETGYLRRVTMLVAGAESIAEVIRKIWQNPLADQFINRSFNLNEPYTVEHLLSEVWAPILLFTGGAPSDEPKVVIQATYVGHKVVNGLRTAEIRWAMTTPPAVTYLLKDTGTGRWFYVNNIKYEAIQWLDPTRGYVVLHYEVLSMEARTSGSQGSARSIGVMTLDRSR